MVLKEIKDVHESKYPEAEFTAKCIEIGIKIIGKSQPKPEVYLVFEGQEEPMELAIRGFEKLSQTGTISDFFQLGKFISSLRKLGIKPLIDDDPQAPSFKTEPNLVGKVLHMKPVNERKVIANDETKTYRDWIIEEIKEPGKTTVAPDTPKPGLTPELKQKWEDFLIENLIEPLNETGVHKLMVAKIPDAAARKPYADVRKLVLQELTKEGKLTINDKAQYSVV